MDGISHRRYAWRAGPIQARQAPLAEQRDVVLVLGDFGFVWDGSKAEQKKLDWLRKRPYTLLFLDGSHENYDLLAQYPTRSCSAARSRHWAAMSIMSAGAVC